MFGAVNILESSQHEHSEFNDILTAKYIGWQPENPERTGVNTDFHSRVGLQVQNGELLCYLSRSNFGKGVNPNWKRVHLDGIMMDSE